MIKKFYDVNKEPDEIRAATYRAIFFGLSGDPVLRMLIDLGIPAAALARRLNVQRSLLTHYLAGRRLIQKERQLVLKEILAEVVKHAEEFKKRVRTTGFPAPWQEDQRAMKKAFREKGFFSRTISPEELAWRKKNEELSLEEYFQKIERAKKLLKEAPE